MAGSAPTLYLNHAGTSWPKPAPVREAIQSALEAPVDAWAETFARHRERVADAFAISDPERLLLTPGCTSALQVAVSDHPWAAGDKLVTSGWEHHALLRPALELRRQGVEHLIVGPGRDGALVDLLRLEEILRGGRVRLVAMCAATNVTGALLPIAEVIRLAHDYGAYVLIDAAQTAGWLDIDVGKLGADLLAFAGHKGPQAPWGIGGLYVAKRVAMRSPRLAEAATMVGYCDTGSVDRLALAGLVAGLGWLAAPAQRDRLERARAVIARIRELAASSPVIRAHGPAAASARMPTLALTWAGQRTSDVAARLRLQGVHVSGGHQCAPLAHTSLGTHGDGVVRISAGPETTMDEADRAGEALARLATP